MKKDTFIKGAAIATICMFIAKVLGILYVIPFYNIIGEQGGALYGYAYSIYSIFLSISTAGIPTAVSKAISEYDALENENAKNSVYKVALKVISVICITAFLVLIIFAPTIAHLIKGSAVGGNSLEDITLVIRCVSFAIIIVPFLSVTRGLLQGNKYITPTSKSEIIEQILRISVLLLGSYVVIKALNKSITTGVCVSVLGASVGALGAYLYLRIVIKKNTIIKPVKKISKSLNKEIINKIIKYAVPLIIVSAILSIYNFTDMVLTLRTMTDILGFTATQAERIISVYTTWGEKFQRIVAVCATAVSISLIPNIVRSYVKKEKNSLEIIINRAIELVIFVGLPLTLLISIFSNEVWAVFFGFNELGPTIISYSIFIGLIASLSTTVDTMLQSMNKFKQLYISVIVGAVINALLDVPLILLMHKLGFNPCYGSITSSVIGFGISIVIVLHAIKKECGIKYSNIASFLIKLILPLIGLLFSAFFLKYFIKIDLFNNKIITTMITCVLFGLPLFIYAFISYKKGLLMDLFSEERINKIFKRRSKDVK